MTLITIREKNSNEATISFNHRDEYTIAVTDPFSEEDRERFAWYFSKYMHFPFGKKQKKAQEVAASISEYGHALFSMVFQSDMGLYARYYQARQARGLRFEIYGSPEFHALHWEALKDPELPRPFALEGSFVRRSNRPLHKSAPWLDVPTLNILIVSARHSEQPDVPYRSISSPIINALHTSSLRTVIRLVRPGTYQALGGQLETARDQKDGFHLIHFDVHGQLLTYEALQKGYSDKRYQPQPYGRSVPKAYEGEKAFLFFEGQQGAALDPVPAEALANLLGSHPIPIVILNACYSAKQVTQTAVESSLASHLMSAGPQVVLAFGDTVTITAANLLVETLYQQIFAKTPIESAIRRARLELYNRQERQAKYNRVIELTDWLLPVVYQNEWPELRLSNFPDFESERAYYQRQGIRYRANQPTYGFIGRDADMLQIERRLTHNLLLVQGVSGIGKTTLLQHLAEWWQTTNLREHIFYIDYTRQTITTGKEELKIGQGQLLTQIAKTLFGLAEYHRAIEPFPPSVQQEKLAEKLRAEPHLLILDQLETISDESHKAALRDFLGGLVGGKTWLLLGSQNDVQWLRKRVRGVLVLRKRDVYKLPALKDDVAFALAVSILEEHDASHHLHDEAFPRLLKPLGGHPQALQNELLKLVDASPIELLQARQTAPAPTPHHQKAESEASPPPKIDTNPPEITLPSQRELKSKMNLIPLRKNLNQMFDDAQLDAFCLQNFPDVYDRFSRGMRKDEKITWLLDHCRRVPEREQRLKELLSVSNPPPKPAPPTASHANSPKKIGQLAFKEKRKLVNLLLACPSVSNQTSRQAIINQLRDEIKNNYAKDTVNRVDVMNIVTACLNYDGGIEDLIEIVGFFEDDSRATQNLNKFLLKLDGE